MIALKNCAENQTRICKAYIVDCYGHIANAFNTCKNAEREILKNNIFDMLDRIKILLNNYNAKDENNQNLEIENNSVDETD